MEFLLAALTLGFLGSFHCVGMCGPIALALPLNGENTARRAAGALLYNAGRIVTYSLFGVLFGLLGKGFVIAGYQQALSIGLGALILLSLILSKVKGPSNHMTTIMFSFLSKIKFSLGKLLKSKNYTSVFWIGMLNGLLPCGLVYVGVAGAIATGSAVNGALFMAFFGLGTFPAMFLVSMISHTIGTGVRNKIRKVVPVMVGLMACVLILRGMNLGIPYISPELSKTDCTKHTCCHKK